MRNESKQISPEGSLLDEIIKGLRENDSFLGEKAVETHDEIVNCVNDAISNPYFTAATPEEDIKSCITFFVRHVLMPSGYGIYLDLLAGNLPSCFVKVRLMLESLVKCYVADCRYPDVTFFEERIELLDKALRQERCSISELMRQLGERLGIGNEFGKLWRALSNDWVHTKGIANNIASHMANVPGLPSWALVIPMPYSDADLEVINKLGKVISQFRELLKIAIETYRTESIKEKGTS